MQGDLEGVPQPYLGHKGTTGINHLRPSWDDPPSIWNFNVNSLISLIPSKAPSIKKKGVSKLQKLYSQTIPAIQMWNDTWILAITAFSKLERGVLMFLSICGTIQYREYIYTKQLKQQVEPLTCIVLYN